MHLTVNGEIRTVHAERLDAALLELGYHGARIATALNGVFVPASQRVTQVLIEGDALEILAPMQGG